MKNSQQQQHGSVDYNNTTYNEPHARYSTPSDRLLTLHFPTPDEKTLTALHPYTRCCY